MVENRLKALFEIKKALEDVATMAKPQMQEYYLKVMDDIRDLIINETELFLLENQSNGLIKSNDIGKDFSGEDYVIKTMLNACK